MDNDDVDSESDGDDAASTPADNGQRLVSRVSDELTAPFFSAFSASIILTQ